MAAPDLVRSSRDGDQFHYHWAARHCLELLPGGVDLVSVTIEGPSSRESAEDDIDAGEEIIDVGLYFGAESRDRARLVRYVQLKHSTQHSLEAWTASGLKKTVAGFAKRYGELVERFSVEDVARRFKFEFTTNRPIDSKVLESIEDVASGAGGRHPEVCQLLIDYSGLKELAPTDFFRLFSAEGGQPDLWALRNLLTQDIGAYLADADFDAPVQLKELVTRKATTEFASDPSIRRHDVLRALKCTEEQLQPAQSLIASPIGTLIREREEAILEALLGAKGPVLIHAEAGVGKSILAARLAVGMPAGSRAVLYDCFGDGLYRNALHFRHRHRDALVQIANQLAGLGLCHPIIPTAHADTKQYMRAFLHRLSQSATLLRAKHSGAQLCLIIDAADNAEIAAEEQREPASFVRDLIRAPLPQGVCLAFTCRTHRKDRLGAPPDAVEIHLEPFSQVESGQHLRRSYPFATEADVLEFSFLTSSNPRLQALALSRGLPLDEMLKQLGPTPMTVERAIGGLLESAIARLRDQAGPTEASQIDTVCEALAVLRPLIPITVLARLSQTSESAIRSFALDFGRPLLLKGDSLHFLDEPAETWFRERFHPSATGLTSFVSRLRPLASASSYVSAALPSILLQAGMLQELVELALSDGGLPTDNPLARRDVELQRLTFALKACLQQGRHLEATKLALRAGAESAAEQRQNNLIQRDTGLAAALIDPDRIEDIVSRRTFGSEWMGSHHAYDAGLLSGRKEFSAEAASRLRMAFDWLNAWVRLPEERRRSENVSDEDRAELAMALLRLRGPAAAAGFLRSWTWRHIAFSAGNRLAQRLIDLGRYDQLDALCVAAGNDVWLLLGLADAAHSVAHRLPAAPIGRLLRLLGDRRVKLPASGRLEDKWDVLFAVESAIELALRALPPDHERWAAVLRKYLPVTPPSDLGSPFGFERAPLLRAYALEAALRGTQVALADVAPADVRKQIETGSQYGRSQETEVFLREVGGLLPWIVLSAAIACGQPTSDLSTKIIAALKETSLSDSRNYQRDPSLRQAVALEWFRLLRDAGHSAGPEFDKFSSWLVSHDAPIWPSTLTYLCRFAGRIHGLESAALGFAGRALEALEESRDNAESRADSYLELARAIYVTSPAEAGAYFNRAVEIASRIGDENLSRWTALLHLASASAVRGEPRPQTAYRLSRAAELTYEYVVRDKHFDWSSTVEALTDLCPCSAIAILSRWRDRRFGDSDRLLPIVIYRLVERDLLPRIAPIALGGVEARWHRLEDLERILDTQPDSPQRSVAAQIAYRYIRVLPADQEAWAKIKELGARHKVHFPGIERLSASNERPVQETQSPTSTPPSGERQRRVPDWDSLFEHVQLVDADGLRLAYASVRDFDPPYEFEAFFREVFARARSGTEPEVIRALGASPDFGIFELRYLLDAFSLPWPKQISFRNALREVVLAACRREPQYVQRSGWGAYIPFERLDSDGIVSGADVVHATLEGFTTRLDTLDAGELFRLIHSLAACLSPNKADQGLNFGLDLLEEILRPSDGDGPWNAALQPPELLLDALAGYVWAGLGSPIVVERWQFAHAVRCAVELGWYELVGALAAAGANGAASPFIDSGLFFYHWHACQWLLIGLARGGVDNPKSLKPAVPFLEGCLRQEHVLIRAFAAESLRTLLAAGEYVHDDPAQLEAVNRSQLPEEVYNGWSAPVVKDTIEVGTAETGDEKYYFGLDIKPYWFAPLGRAFGLTEHAVERRVKHVLRRNMGWNGGGWDSDARHKRKLFAEGSTYHSHGSMPKADDLIAYHGYHGMMLAAAALLKDRPTQRSDQEADSRFEQWMSQYRLTLDRRWLFDRRDPRAVVEPPLPKGYDDRAWLWRVMAAYLDQQLIMHDGGIVFWAHTTAGDGHFTETLSVRSALVSGAGAEALVAALQTAPEIDHFVLPSADRRDYDSDNLEAGDLKLTGWVSDKTVSGGLDHADPWAEGIHFPGPAPSDDVVSRLGLSSSSDGRTWTAGGDGLLRSETWTHIQGYGRDSETVAGWRLSGDQRFLKRLLGAHPNDRLVVSVAVRRRVSGHQKQDLDFYRNPYARYYLMGGDGVAHAL
jgi:hypothetical protein